MALDYTNELDEVYPKLGTVDQITIEDDEGTSETFAVQDSTARKHIGTIETSLEAHPLADLDSRITVLESNSGNNTSYDDTALVARVEALENKTDNDTVYDDSALSARVTALENKADNDTVYDDTALVARVTALEAKEDNDTVYDDTDVKARLSALEAKEDKDTVYDDTALVTRIAALEEKTDNDTIYDDTALTARITALEENDISSKIGSMTLKKTLVASAGTPDSWTSLGRSWTINGSRFVETEYNGTYFTKSGFGGLYKSTDGINWTDVLPRSVLRGDTGDEDHTYSNFGMYIDQNYGRAMIAAFGKLFIYGWNGIIYYSDIDDCSINSWIALNETNLLDSVSSDDSNFVTILNDKVYFVVCSTVIAISEDLSYEVTKLDVEIDLCTSEPSIRKFNDKFVTIINDKLYISEDLLTWTNTNQEARFLSIANGNLYLICDENDGVTYTSDLETFAVTAYPEEDNLVYYGIAVTYFNGNYYFFEKNDVYKSANADLSNAVALGFSYMEAASNSNTRIFVVGATLFIVNRRGSINILNNKDEIVATIESNSASSYGYPTFIANGVYYVASPMVTLCSKDSYEYKITDLDLSNGNIVKVSLN